MTELRRALPFLLLPLILLAAGCGLLPFASAAPGGASGAAITAHEAQWKAQGVQSYTWDVSFLCECGISGPTTITVVDGTATEFRGQSGPVPLEQVAGFPLTVDDLYAKAFDALRGGGTVSVTWAGPSGLPSTIQLDPVPNAIDDELSMTVTHLEPAR